MPVGKPYIECARSLLEKQGIALPVYPQFQPDDSYDTVALLQPEADVIDDELGVRSINHALAVGKVASFLCQASQKGASICVTPEYCCPWEVIDRIIAGDIEIPNQSIWILGCEAISIADLRTRQAGTAEKVAWIFEDPEPNQEQGQTFLDPVCILARGKRIATDQEMLVAIVQFKTEAMGGTDFEQRHLIRGARIYELRNGDEYSIRLVCLLCSDVLQHPGDKFANLTAYFDSPHRVLLLHLQLNRRPRHDLYRPYRELVLRRHSRQLITLNWARDAKLTARDGAVSLWKNSSVSAIYSRRWIKKGLNNAAIDECERRGLYFCYSSSLRAVVAILNFREYAFCLRLSRVSQEAAAGHHQTYSPPQVIAVLKWNTAAASWVDEDLPVDSEVDKEVLACKLNIASLTDVFSKPQIFERFATLSLGAVHLHEDVRESTWPQIDSVDAACLDQGETILRTTFAQDSLPKAKQFRQERYSALERFNAIRTGNLLPKRMSLYNLHTVTFDFAHPYSNLRAADGRLGTAIYVHNGDALRAQTLYTRIQKHLQLLENSGVDRDHVVVWHLGPLVGGATPVVPFPPDKTPHTTDDPDSDVGSIAGDA